MHIKYIESSNMPVTACQPYKLESLKKERKYLIIGGFVRRCEAILRGRLWGR